MKLSLCPLLVVAAWFGSAMPLRAKETPPNIIFILVDDLRWDALGCAGHPFVKTPNLDRLAKEGALFRNCFVTTPLCSPSRASFLTGQYVHTHGIRDNTNRGPASHKLITFPKLLRDAGYETAYVGKWHMGRDDSPRPGFDRWVSFKGQGVYQDPPLNIDGKEIKAKGYMTDLLNGHAVDFVKKKRTRPFALYLAHKAVHGPFTPADRHKNLYEDARFTPPPNLVEAARSRESKPALRAVTRGTNNVTLTDGKASARDFPIMLKQMQCLASIDDGVGDLLKALEETRLLGSTVIVFSSDNGFFWREHALGDKRWAYEPSLRIPLLIRYPKLVKAGSRLEQLTLNIDIAPTLLDLAGVKVPTTMQGRSLVSFLKGEKVAWRKSLLAEYFRDGMFVCPPWQAVRTDRWKYIHYPENKDSDELYDLQTDPHEMKNLIGEAKVADQLKEMKAELTRLLKETGAK